MFNNKNLDNNGYNDDIFIEEVLLCLYLFYQSGGCKMFSKKDIEDEDDDIFIEEVILDD